MQSRLVLRSEQWRAPFRASPSALPAWRPSHPSLTIFSRWPTIPTLPMEPLGLDRAIALMCDSGITSMGSDLSAVTPIFYDHLEVALKPCCPSWVPKKPVILGLNFPRQCIAQGYYQAGFRPVCYLLPTHMLGCFCLVRNRFTAAE